MATTVVKTRTNYFAVKDKEAFAKLVENLETDDDKAELLNNKQGEVGFAVDGAVLGINPNEKITKDMLKNLKTAFVNTSVEGWKKETIDRLIQAVESCVCSNSTECDEMETEMIHQIQSLIEPGHACIITEISYEKLRFLDGMALIITQNNFQFISLNNAALETAKTMLGNPNYNPDMAY